MKKLFLHIGTHKTGTTAIQKFARKNSKIFNQNSFHHIKDDFIPFDVRQSLVNNVEVDNHLIEKLRRLLQSELRTKKNKVFLSWEGFSGSFSKSYINTSIALSVLREAIPETVEVELIISFRRQDEFLQSIYSQMIHQGQFIDFKDFISKIDKVGFNWLTFLDKINRIFYNSAIHVLPYDPNVLQDKNIVNLIGERIGLEEWIKTEDIPQSNVGMSPISAKTFKRLIPKIAGSELKKNILRQNLQKCGNKGVFQEYQYMEYGEKTDFLDYYEVSNKELAKIYWEQPYGLTNFSVPIQDYNLKEKFEQSEQDELILVLLDQIEKEKKMHKKNLLLRISNKLSELLTIQN